MVSIPNRDSSGRSLAPTASPFTAKEVDGKKLYKRIHGCAHTLTAGTNEILFTVPYPEVKIEGVEILNAEMGDYVSFYVLDKAVDPIYGVPNLVLNQFGFNVYVTPDHYRFISQYDSDLVEDFQLKTVFESATAKTIYINYMLNELKA